MGNDNTKPLGGVIGIDEGRIERHVSELVRGSVEKTLNELLDAEADALCNAPKYSRSPERTDSRAGHYTRKLHTGAGRWSSRCRSCGRRHSRRPLLSATGAARRVWRSR